LMMNCSEISFKNEEHFKKFIKNTIRTNCPTIQKISFSITPYGI
jgi:hypothetical protein